MKLVPDPTTEEMEVRIRDEQEEILRELHRELESIDRRVTRSRARSLSIPLRIAPGDPDETRRESIRRGKLPIRTGRRRANEAVRLIPSDTLEPDDAFADVAEEIGPSTTLGVEPEFDDEGHVLRDGGMLYSDDSSSASDDEF